MFAKCLLILAGLLLTGIALLQLRQQRLELEHRTALLHRDLQKSQAQLWRQQLAIATYTSPQVVQQLRGTPPAKTSIDAASIESVRE